MNPLPDKIWFFQFNNGVTACEPDPERAKAIISCLDENETVTEYRQVVETPASAALSK